MEEVMHQYKRTVLGEENSNLNFDDKKDGEMFSTEKGAEFLVMGVVFTDGKEVTVLPDRPPPEPPPWRTGEARVWIFWRQRKYFLFCFACFFSDCYFCIGVCFFFYVPVCKTLILDMGDEKNLVTVLGFLFPGYESANYIATAINSKSGSRDDSYQFSFCPLTHTLNRLFI
ncbi:unnamed protein product [Cuscuta epithymum]|uniref:Uncharacterized protein n=1 Tax=Cuscuta epithymum TaxID=186058 RepID=A0AAV0DZX4_9ASTE|nr:unnamed protein product [Cuscuta epithymum]